MYDDDEDDEEEIVEEASGPASGGYGDDDSEDDGGDDEEEDAEATRQNEASAARGKEDRTFYDDLAKKEDQRHNAMRADLQKRSLVVAEERQKLRHKEAELRALDIQINIEKDRIDYEQKKAYRHAGNIIKEDASVEVSSEHTPILSKDIDADASSREFSIERAEAHIKQMQNERAILDKGFSAMMEHLHEEERALSQLQHQLTRM